MNHWEEIIISDQVTNLIIIDQFTIIQHHEPPRNEQLDPTRWGLQDQFLIGRIVLGRVQLFGWRDNHFDQPVHYQPLKLQN